jgi:cbb3-type cytochrome c oxidase subunit III
MPRKRTRDWGTDVLAGVVMLLSLGLAFGAGIGGFFLGRATKHPKPAAVVATSTLAQPATIDPHVAAGAHDFVVFACAQCHGEQGRGGVSTDVPALTNVSATLKGPRLRSIINHGLGESANPTKPYMPVWGAVISTTQVNDLVAYIAAGLPVVPTATPPPAPRNQGLAVAGSVLYVRYGCVNCHGPNGLGGVPNPRAPDKAIPPLAGQGFRGDFNTDAKIIDIIKTGSVLGKAPIVSMPHWGGILSDENVRALVAYLKTLK